MKKLIMMMAAAVTGMFAFGDVTPVSDGFEAAEWSIAAPWSLPEQDGAVVAPADWSSVARPSTLTVPVGFKGFGEKFLSIKTGLSADKALSMAFDQEIPATQNNSEGLYFDSVVKFTACDGEDAVADLDGAKLAIWTKEIVDAKDEIVGTNLFVTAGKYVSGEVTQYNYDLGAIADGWHRVTIRAIKDISAAAEVNPGFVVFIDTVKQPLGKGDTIGDIQLNGIAKGWEGYLFPSLVQEQTPSSRKIASVDFAGQGSVDDVIVTDAIPFDEAKDKFFEIEVGENVETVTYYVNGAEQGTTVTSGVSIPLEGASMSVRFEATYESDSETTYGRGIWTLDGTPFDGDTVDGITTSGRKVVINAKDVTPRIQIGDKAYPNFKEAIAAIAEATEPVTMTLNKDVKVGYNTETSMSDAFFEADVDVTLDLAGKKLESEENAGGDIFVIMCQCPNFTIKDSSEGQTGKIVASADQAGAVGVGVCNLIVEGGTFDGAVVLVPQLTNSAVIKAGKFLKSANGGETFTLVDSVPKTSKLDDTDDTYFIVTELQQWTVTFLKDKDDVEPFATAQVVDGGFATAPEEDPTKDYYTFAGWDFAFATPIKENTTILAKWNAKQYTITYNDKHGDPIDDIADQYTKFTYETKSMALYAPESPDSDGYDFGGWTDATMNPFDGTDFSGLDWADVDENDGITLDADFSKAHEYTVSYDGNGADSGEVASQTITVDEDVDAAENAFVKANANFTGWNTQADGEGTPYAVGETISITEAPGNVTLYAQWESAGPGPVEPGQDKELEAETEEDAKAEIAKLTPAPTAEQIADGIKPEDLQLVAVNRDGKWYAVAEPAQKYAPEVNDQADKPIEVTDTQFKATIETKAGFYYGFVECESVGGTFAPAADFVKATGESLTLEAPKKEGATAEFFKLSVSAIPVSAKQGE